MGKKIPLDTRDEDLLSQSICDIMDDQDLFIPMATPNLFMAMERLHFSTHLYHNKMLGRWCFSNREHHDWPDEKKTKCIGTDIVIYDHTAEMAIARGVHYYYHLKIKD